MSEVAPGGVEGVEGVCAVCGGRRFDDPIVAFDRTVARADDYVYARCHGCGLVSMVPTPRHDEIDGFYPDENEPHAPDKVAAHPGLGFFERQAAQHRYATCARRREDALGRLLWLVSAMLMRDVLDPRGKSRLLDVGCGSGRLLARHRDLGWEVRAEQVE